MKDLVKQYLDQGLSRRQFLSGLGRAGLTSAAATAMANSLAPFVAHAQTQATTGERPWMREIKGTGGALLVAQLKAAGVRHLFCSPSAAVGPFFDALVDEPEMVVIKALEEGTLGAISDGYAKASGKPAFAMIDAAGLPAFMGQMYISSVDRMPVVVAVDDNQIPNVTNGITKWQWIAERPDTLPAVARQALKFATTHPAGPVFLVLDGATLRGEGQAGIMDKEKFDVPMTARPDPALIQQAARMLLEAESPLLYFGDEVTWCGGAAPRASSSSLPSCWECRQPSPGESPCGRSRSRPATISIRIKSGRRLGIQARRMSSSAWGLVRLHRSAGEAS
jgi:hypothetical protein